MDEEQAAGRVLEELELAAEAGIVPLSDGAGNWLIWRPKEEPPVYFTHHPFNSGWHPQHFTKFTAYGDALKALPSARAAIRRKVEEGTLARDMVGLAKQVEYLATWSDRGTKAEMEEQLEAIASLCLRIMAGGDG